ncbi:MAG: hypothetical protein M1153_02435 [Patescibacteria group bacterium]|nr:hypothetical protein [Patescibacteria group bacterium]
MKVIPAINCKDFDCVSDKLLKSAEFSDWVQIDVSDGKFSEAVTWDNPKEIFSFMGELGLALKVEAHLMVEDAFGESLRWLAAGAKRVIVQAEADFDIEDLTRSCAEYGAELMLSISPKTDIGDKSNLLPAFNEFQILSVSPGFAGQKFDGNSLAKIKSLRELFPNAIIEVDGGVNAETAEQAKSAGADIITSASYIFENENPKEAFQRLASI